MWLNDTDKGSDLWQQDDPLFMSAAILLYVNPIVEKVISRPPKDIRSACITRDVYYNMPR